ncbi:alpha-hydroxy acid oxidase [Aquabacterium sp. J223]|uniref:alpha-hydroxy acid oxidase n=1 Tax=Aquabacterium sp. J223 TaxID=2898431 RepID=UPI0021ADDB1A|nr:alpha-hydroxy acid oxidase [Aquabacterium sp. J223]UUX95313.1 alpha-hydroxy-acid oxidizing protein [Aquabacterium sp. J223]
MSRRLDRCFSFDDIRRLARRRLPRILFDVIDSGVEDERLLARNEQAFADRHLVPRQMQDVGRRSQAVTLFGRRYASPVGVAPTGLAGLFRPGAESALARAAAACDVPFVLSGACLEALESVASIAPDRTWYQLYAARDWSVSQDLMARARAQGIEVLVLTVDAPVYPKRERDLRNGFGLPLKPTPSLLLEALRHPAWIADHLRHGGLPMMHTWARYAGPNADAAAVFAYFRSQSPSVQTWRDLDLFRRHWPGRLVVKGLQHPDDGVRAAEAGVDGIIVSNHGGKALDRGPAALDMLPGMAAAVGERVTVMMDSGVRRGADAVIARCLGAQCTFVGRAPLYGVIAAGEPGVRRVLDLLRDEIDRTLGLIGVPDFEALGPQALGPRVLHAGAAHPSTPAPAAADWAAAA